MDSQSGRRTASRRVRKSRWIVAVIILLGQLPPTAHAAPEGDSLHLDQVITDVLQHNDRAAAARYMEQSAKSKIGPAGAWDDPMVMLGIDNVPTSFDFTMDPMTMKMVGLSQNIPYAGQKGLQKKAAQADAEAAGADRREVQLDLITAAKTAYFDLFYRRRTLDDLTHQHDLLDQVVQSVRAKLTTNQANQEDVVAAQADLWRLESEILSAQQEVDAAWSNLRSLRGRDTGDSIPSLATPPIAESPDSVGPWLAAARAHYPPLQRLQRQSISYGFSAAAAQRMRLPMLNLQAKYGMRTGSDMGVPRDNMLSLQATFSLPIFSGRQQGQMALSMQSMQKSVDAEAMQLWRETEANLRTLHRRVRRLTESLDLYRDRIIPAAQEAYASALAGYNSSRTSFVSLLTYAVSIYRDRITANQIANELARAMAEAERYTTDVDAIAGAGPTEAR